MDLSYSQEYLDFREEVVVFLNENWRTKKIEKSNRAAEQRALRAKAVDAGYMYRSVPREYGGSGQKPDVLKSQIIQEEFARARAPSELTGVGQKMLVPTLLENGTEEQKLHFIPKTLSGEISWTQGYSEPGAGSDIASLKTRAELKGDKWVLNGQKVWSSFAQEADFMFLLARTEPGSQRYNGISYLLLDLRQPGVEIRPLKQMSGWSEFCEVFFNDAEVPADWLVGERGQGWSVSKSTLKHERSYIGSADRLKRPFQKLVELAKSVELNGAPAIRDPAIRQRLARIAAMLSTQTYSSLRQLSMAARGEDAGIIHLMFKLNGTNINHEIAKTSREIIGDSFMLEPPTKEAWRSAGPEKWNNQFMGSLGIAIAGGTSNIQRNILAERGLGLKFDDEGNPL